MIDFGKKTIASLVDERKRAEYAEWLAYLEGLLETAGAMDGSERGLRRSAGANVPWPTLPASALASADAGSVGHGTFAPADRLNVNGEIERRFSKTPYVYDRVPRRDERFQDLWNQGVNAEAFLYDRGAAGQAQDAR